MADLYKTVTETFREKKIVIVGDLVADQFLNGTIERVSREAPVFILRHDVTTTHPGAAANAAANVASLGGRPVLIGLVGNDRNGEMLLAKLSDDGVDVNRIVVTDEFQTTTKVRVLAGQHYAARQQVIRIDYENSNEISAARKAELRAAFAGSAADAGAIIISDYNYGAVFAEVFDDAREMSRNHGIPLIVDSRYRLGDFREATTATPNREEVEQMLGKDFTARQCSQLRERLGYEALVVTNGNEGLVVYERGREPINLPAVGSTEPIDVTGAGDTVIAAYGLGLASGLSFVEAASVANHAGGIVVMKKNTASVDSAELAASVYLENEAVSRAVL